MPLSAILMVGGTETKMEIFDTVTSKICTAELELPDKRSGHTIDVIDGEIIVCGGGSAATQNTCIRLTDESGSYKWEEYATLPIRYAHHSSWVTPIGELQLMGSNYDGYYRRSDIVNKGQVKDFLRHSARRTCSIQFPNKLYMIGGYGSNRAFEYNSTGFVRELPRMKHSHDYNGCGSYHYNNETVLMAIGAYNSDKAEIYTESAGWIEVESVPYNAVMIQNSVAIVDNILYLVGGYGTSPGSSSWIWHKEILKFNPDTLSWTKVGETPYAMKDTAVIPITNAEAMALCNVGPQFQ